MCPDIRAGTDISAVMCEAITKMGAGLLLFLISWMKILAPFVVTGQRPCQPPLSWLASDHAPPFLARAFPSPPPPSLLESGGQDQASVSAALLSLWHLSAVGCDLNVPTLVDGVILVM